MLVNGVLHVPSPKCLEDRLPELTDSLIGLVINSGTQRLGLSSLIEKGRSLVCSATESTPSQKDPIKTKRPSLVNGTSRRYTHSLLFFYTLPPVIEAGYFDFGSLFPEDATVHTSH